MGKSVDFYLSKGFDLPTAKYYANGRRKITAVEPADNYTLIITFDNGEKRLYNVAPLIKEGTVTAALKDLDRFNSVYLDEQHCVSWDIDPNIDSNKVWNNKIDLCPDSCYIDSIPIK